MRKINHWTPKYIGNRLALAIYEQQHRDYPWLTRTAISILSSYLKPSDVGLEWGCGRSTVWFAARMKHLVSVEDNPQWYEIVKNKLARLVLRMAADSRRNYFSNSLNRRASIRQMPIINF